MIPNPRDNKRKRAAFKQAQQNVLTVLQYFVLTLALLILATVMQ